MESEGKLKNHKNWLKSSQDENSVSNTVRGAVLAFSSLMLLAAKYFELPLTESDVVEIATQIGAASGALWLLYGMAMKVVMKLGKK